MSDPWPRQPAQPPPAGIADLPAQAAGDESAWHEQALQELLPGNPALAEALQRAREALKKPESADPARGTAGTESRAESEVGPAGPPSP